MLYNSKGLLLKSHVTKLCNTHYLSTGYPMYYIERMTEIELPGAIQVEQEPWEHYLQDQVDACFQRSELKQWASPQLHYMPFEEVMIYQPIMHKEQLKGLVFVGPMRLNDANTLIYERLRQKYPRSDLISLKTYYGQLPKVELIQLMSLQYLLAIMLQSTMIESFQIQPGNPPQGNAIPPSSVNIPRDLKHHAYQREERFINDLLVSTEDPFRLQNKHFQDIVAIPLAADPIRSEKNRFIIGAASFSRAAIRHGVPSETAFSYSDYYINQIEEQDTMEQVIQLMADMIDTYRRLTQEARSKAHLSPMVKDVIAYAEEHIEQHLALHEIAEKLGYSYKYLSRCFVKETGTRFSDYIYQKKIKAAKRLLKDLSLSIEDISEYLGFSQPYYFSQVFKKYEGMTPSAYRKKLF